MSIGKDGFLPLLSKYLRGVIYNGFDCALTGNVSQNTSYMDDHL